MIKLYAVDDEPGFLEIVEAVATPMGFDVVQVLKSRLFKSVYLGEPNAVVLIDMIMPEVDGIEVFNWLARERPPGAVIFVSGYNEGYPKMAAALAQSSRIALIETLLKPIKLAQLRETLTKAKNAICGDEPSL